MTVFVLRAATSMDLNCKFTIEHLHQTTTTKTTKKKKRKEDEEKVLTPNILTVAFLLYSNFLIAPSIQRISQFFLHLSIENVWAVEKFTHQRKCSLSLSLSQTPALKAILIFKSFFILFLCENVLNRSILILFV